jgi:arylsulfatase A-like enzyme
MTGRYPTRVGVPRVLNPHSTTGLAGSETTVAQALKTRGYRTICIGKWHLGHLPQFLPTRRGFDEYLGIPYSNDMDPAILLDNESTIEDPVKQDTLTRRYTERALDFIRRSKDAPFFLYLPHTFPHIPLFASERFRGRSPLGLYGDVVEELDWSVGEVLTTLRRHALEERTLVMFGSDNGPWYQGSAGRLRGRKGTTWDGGQRVPFLARWPGRIPAGVTCPGVASVMDILPTVANLCGATLPAKPLDGIDIMPLLAAQKRELDREVLLYFSDIHLQCARLGRFKLHVARWNSLWTSPAPPEGRLNLPLPAPELYDLVSDPEESYDVAPENPKVVAELQSRIERLMPGFPDEIRKAYAGTRSQRVEKTAAGNFPKAANTPGK